ncbi:hypothetical protein D3C74_403020 [compost metagenome]
MVRKVPGVRRVELHGGRSGENRQNAGDEFRDISCERKAAVNHKYRERQRTADPNGDRGTESGTRRRRCAGLTGPGRWGPRDRQVDFAAANFT